MSAAIIAVVIIPWFWCFRAAILRRRPCLSMIRTLGFFCSHALRAILCMRVSWFPREQSIRDGELRRPGAYVRSVVEPSLACRSTLAAIRQFWYDRFMLDPVERAAWYRAYFLAAVEHAEARADLVKTQAWARSKAKIAEQFCDTYVIE